jgi:hypothetical protein
MNDLYSNKDLVSSSIKIEKTGKTVLDIETDTVMNPMSPNYDPEKEIEIVEQIVDEMKKSNPDQTNPEQGISRVDITAKKK